jgi:hypothetical protein
LQGRQNPGGRPQLGAAMSATRRLVYVNAQALIKLVFTSAPNRSEASRPPPSSGPRSTGKYPVCSISRAPRNRGRRPVGSIAASAGIDSLGNGLGVLRRNRCKKSLEMNEEATRIVVGFVEGQPSRQEAPLLAGIHDLAQRRGLTVTCRRLQQHDRRRFRSEDTIDNRRSPDQVRPQWGRIEFVRVEPLLLGFAAVGAIAHQ